MLLFKKMNYDFSVVYFFRPLSALKKQQHQHANCYSMQSDPVHVTLMFNFPWLFLPCFAEAEPGTLRQNLFSFNSF